MQINSANLYYGFKAREFTGTGISDADLKAQLGWIIPPETIPSFMDGNFGNALLIIRANAPKPPRVTKKTTATGTTGDIPKTLTLFCSPLKVAAARATGWQLAKNGIGVKFVGEASSARQITAFVEVSGEGSDTSSKFYYGFSCDRATFSNYGALLGLQSTQQLSADQREKRCFMGASFPKPKRASLKTANGNISSFCSSDNVASLISAGWSIKG